MSQHPELLRVLEQLGLRDHEARIYLSATALGQATVLSLARDTGIKRGTVYETLPRLLDRGLLKETVVGKKRMYIAEDPRQVSAIYKQRVHNLDHALPQLLAIQNANGRKPRITYYEGEPEVWRIYEDTLRVGLPIASYTSITGITQYLNPHKIEDYFKRRVAKRIPVRGLAVDSPESRVWAANATQQLRDIRLVPPSAEPFVADVEIYGDKVAIISYADGLFGIIIESPQIARLQRWSFDLMWAGATDLRSGGKTSTLTT